MLTRILPAGLGVSDEDLFQQANERIERLQCLWQPFFRWLFSLLPITRQSNFPMVWISLYDSEKKHR